MTDYSSYKYYQVTKPAENVLHVEFNRPKALNAVHRESYLEYQSIFEKAEFDGDVRAIVLSGVGKSFCAGLDVKSVNFDNGHSESARRAIGLYHHIKEFQKAIHITYSINKPVIAVAHGHSLGLALDILSAVDIRFASRDAKLSIREIEIGMAADIGSLQRLPKIVGNIGWLKELTYSGRFFSADEGKEHGLITRVYDTKDEAVKEAIKLAVEIAEKSPVAVYGSKKSLNYAIEHDIHSGLDQIAEFNAHALGEDFLNGVMSAMSKNKPKYAKL